MTRSTFARLLLRQRRQWSRLILTTSTTPTVVVTLLSPSPGSSRRMLERLEPWLKTMGSSTTMPGVTVSTTTTTTTPGVKHSDDDMGGGDALDQFMDKHAPYSWLRFLPGSQRRTMDSVALSLDNPELPSRTVIHWLSVNDDGTAHSKKGGRMELFAIQSSSNRIPADESVILPIIRNHLTEAMARTTLLLTPIALATRTEFTIKNLVRALTSRSCARDFFPPLLSSSRLPILEIDNDAVDDGERGPLNSPTSTPPRWLVGDLNEIVIPAYDFDTYPSFAAADGHRPTTLFAKLRDWPNARRPVTGVYQLFPSAPRLGIRPLPMGKEDRILPPPTLIFHTYESVMNQNVLLQQGSGSDDDLVKIGHSGGSNCSGQFILNHTDAKNNDSGGVDIRLCAAHAPSSMFAEAQESLLAGSLDELQSLHVLPPDNHKSSGSSSSDDASTKNHAKGRRESDPRTNQMDCWVEFRANLFSNPLGFFRLNGPLFRRDSIRKVAKAPDLPFE